MTSNSHHNDEQTVSLRDTIELYSKHWKWLLISVILALVIGWLIAHYQTPVYESSASVLIEQENQGPASDELNMLKDLGLSTAGSVLEDEIEMYKSRSIMERVVRDLHLNWTFEILGSKSGIVRYELYDKNPVHIRSVLADSLLYMKQYSFDIIIHNANEFSVSKGKGMPEGKHVFGSVLQLPVGKVIVEKTREFNAASHGQSIRIKLTPIDQVATAIRKNLVVEPASKEANIILLKVKGHNVEKNNAILNKLIAVHQENAINNKNEVVKNTTAFINDRMKFIAAELSDVEKQGETYKSDHQLVDVTTDAASYLGKEGEIEKKVVDASIELNLADFMHEVIREQNGYDQLLPANLGFKDASIGQMTAQYNALVLERNRMKETSGEKHPSVARLEAQLSGLRSSLDNSLKNMLTSTQLQLKKLKGEEQMYQSKIAAIPQFEREYRDILRQQQIKESLYLFLLQKREQNEISLAATVANSRIIDQAYSNGIPVSPQRKIIYLVAIALGLLVPIGWIYLKNWLNNKINSRLDLESSPLTILGEIPLVKKSEELMILSNPHSSVTEAFRALRSNLSFVSGSGEGSKVISITSSVSGEGKSTTSINLAFIYATLGKKVILIGADLRKPKIKEILDLEQKPGLSNYIVNDTLSTKDIVSNVNRYQTSIDVISSGDIPPNPSELLLHNRLDTLFSELKNSYDVIIVDNAPAGLVIDAITMNRFADVTLYVVRAGMVDKRFQGRIEEMASEQKLTNVCLVLNGVSNQANGYSYTYGYGEAHEKKSFLKRLFKR